MLRKASLIAVLACLGASSWGQGSLVFDNIDGTPPTPVRISGVPGTFNPADGPGGAYVGSNYTASLFFLNGIVTNQMVFDSRGPMLFVPADTHFYGLTGGSPTGYQPAGSFFGDVVDLSAASGQVVTVQVRAWYNGGGLYASYFDALAAGQNVGESNPVLVYLALGTESPPFLDGLNSFAVGIPEPSLFDFLVLCGSVLLGIRLAHRRWL